MTDLSFIPRGHTSQTQTPAAAAGVDYTHTLFVAPFACRLVEIMVAFAAAIAASATLTETFTINSYTAAGAVKTAAIVVRATTTVGFVALASNVLTIALADQVLLAGESLAVVKTHLSTGTAVTAGTWLVKHSGRIS